MAGATDQELDAAAELHRRQAAQLTDPALREVLRRAWATLAPYQVQAGRPVAAVEELLQLLPQLEVAEAVAADLRGLGLVVLWPPPRSN